MKNPPDQPSNQAIDMIGRERGPFWVAMLMLGAAGVYGLYTLLLAFQNQAWQLFAEAGVMFAYCGVIVVSAALSRRGRPEVGMQLMIGAMLVTILLISGLIAGLGLPLALIAVVLTSLVVAQTLSPRRASWAIIVSTAVAVIVVMLDLYGPLAYRLAVPALQIATPGVAGLLALVYGLIIVRQFVNYSLRTKLMVAFIVVSVLSTSAVAVSTNLTTREILTEGANQALDAAASQTAATIDSFIGANLDALSAQAQLPAFVEYLNLPVEQRSGSRLEAETGAVLQALRREDLRFISSYALLDNQGLDVMDTLTSDIGQSKADRDYFREPLETGLPYVSPVQFSESGPGLIALYFSSPVRSDVGQIIGVLRLRYGAAVLQQLIEESNDLAGAQSFAVLFDENLIHLAHGTAPETNWKAVAPLDPTLVAELQATRRLPSLLPTDFSLDLYDLSENLAVAADQPHFTATDPATGDKVNQVAVAPLETRPDWLVAFFQPREVFLAPIQTQTRTTLLFSVAVAVVAAGAGVGLSQLLAGPITRLTDVAQQVGSGALEVQAPVQSQDEIGRLAQVFNRMTAQLRNLIGSLEDQVQARTAELVLSIEVGQRAAAIRDLADLLPTIVEFIRERFDLYYTHVYFVDDVGRNLVLKAGTGAVGQELLARRHSLPIGPCSIVGQVAETARSVVVPDTGRSDIHKPNVLLPETRSEMAVPLIVEGRVLGVLDMQADKAYTFTEANLAVFEAMATQLAISIDSAQQWALAQEAQRKMKRAVALLTRESWAEKLESSGQRQGVGFAYDLSSLKPLAPKINDQTSTGWRSDADRAGAPPGLSVPLLIQNEPVGYLTVNADAKGTWSEDEQVLLKTVAGQLAQKIESLRLFEATQQQATREQLARQITDKMRVAPDVDTIIETGLKELANALSVSRTYAKLTTQLGQSEEAAETETVSGDGGAGDTVARSGRDQKT